MPPPTLNSEEPEKYRGRQKLLVGQKVQNAPFIRIPAILHPRGALW